MFTRNYAQMRNYYDRQGAAITLRTWMRYSRNQKYQRVARDTVGEYKVSTVWLGLNLNFSDGPILIFETMILSNDQDVHGRLWRYTTEAEATEGHKRAVAIYTGPIFENATL